MIAVTIGGVTVGLMILGHVLIGWFPGVKRLQKKPLPYLGQLVPFALAWAYGTIGVLCAMGLIGWVFDTALWASNWLGDAALWLGVGEKPGQSAAGRYVPLTVFGNCMVLIATACMVAGIKKAAVGSQLKLGMWCGLCLGTSSGVAGLAAVPLAQAVNWSGNLLYGAIA